MGTRDSVHLFYFKARNGQTKPGNSMKNETYRKIVKNLKKCIKKNYSFVEFKDIEGVDLQTEVHHVRTAYKNNKLSKS